MRCVRNQAGQVLGVYRADDNAAALDALAQDHDYADFAAWASSDGIDAGQFDVIDAEQALTAKGRKLYGPTHQGFVWYDVADNKRRLDEAGEAGRYKPHAEACSPPYRTEAEAALHALQA